MFAFLKRLFATKQEPKQVTIPFSEIEGFLEEKKGPLREALEQDIKHVLEGIEDARKKVIESLDKVQDAKLQNPNIKNRVNTVMQGNRDMFVRTGKRVFSNLNIEFESIEQMKDRSKKTRQELDDLAETTARSYAILTQFFAREIADVSDHIKKIDTSLKDIEQLIEDNMLTKIEKLLVDIGDAKKQIANKDRLQKEKQDEEKNLEDLKGQIEKANKDLEAKKQSDDHVEYEKLTKELHALEHTLRDLDKKFSHDFLDLEKALKKYAKLAFDNEQLIEQFVAEPFKTLQTDTNHTLLHILSGLHQSLEQDKIDLDDKRKSKALSKIGEINKTYLDKMHEQIKETKEKIDDTESKLKKNKVKKEIDEIKESIHSLEQKQKRSEDTIETTTKDLEKINEETIKKDTQDNINSVVEETVTLS